MRQYLIFFFLISFAVKAQVVEKTKLELADIKTIQQANEYLSSKTSLAGQLIELNSSIDTMDLDKELLSSGVGNLINFESEDKKKYFFFKTLETTQIRSYRVQYIFLDNRKLTIEQIDSLRDVIMRRTKNGEPFDRLAKEYSMDGNAKKGGDLGNFHRRNSF
jgi:parvulin-like peptidyl-prolyl isomerase